MPGDKKFRERRGLLWTGAPALQGAAEPLSCAPSIAGNLRRK